ncbi:hypothetical protein CHU98_g2035 [Xylaria longipes]|nr:hypothetical protein CHU98_g2035 [Xylaria longipes]
MAGLTKSASENFVVSVSLIVFTSLSILIRLALKLYRRQAPQGPDWMCFIATATFLTYSALTLNFIFNVSASHSFDLDPTRPLDELHSLAKLVYTNELLFGFGITTIKLSILWFYHTLFSVDETLQRVIKATTAICILWFIVATLVIALQCMPVHAYWENFDLPPYCLEYPRVLLGYEISNLFIDVAILCIPTGTVMRLQLAWPKKVPIIGIFLLGALVCIASIVRLTAIWRPPNIFQDFDFGGTYLWSSLQLGVAIITSCLPTFGPLLPLLAKPIPYIRTLGAWLVDGVDGLGPTSQSWAYGEEFDSPHYALHPVPSRTILVNRHVESDIIFGRCAPVSYLSVAVWCAKLCDSLLDTSNVIYLPIACSPVVRPLRPKAVAPGPKNGHGIADWKIEMEDAECNQPPCSDVPANDWRLVKQAPGGGRVYGETASGFQGAARGGSEAAQWYPPKSVQAV